MSWWRFPTVFFVVNGSDLNAGSGSGLYALSPSGGDSFYVFEVADAGGSDSSSDAVADAGGSDSSSDAVADAGGSDSSSDAVADAGGSDSSDDSGSLLRVKSPNNSDLSDVSSEADISSSMTTFAEPEPEHWRVRVIPIHAIEAGNRIYKGEITLYEVKGYFSLAREIRGEEDMVENPGMVHACWPWPGYERAEYYDIGGLVLNPLSVEFNMFMPRLDHISLFKEEDNVIPMNVRAEGNMGFTVPINKAMIVSLENLHRAIYFYYCCAEKEEPKRIGYFPDPWPRGVCHYYDGNGGVLPLPEFQGDPDADNAAFENLLVEIGPGPDGGQVEDPGEADGPDGGQVEDPGESDEEDNLAVPVPPMQVPVPVPPVQVPVPPVQVPVPVSPLQAQFNAEVDVFLQKLASIIVDK